MSKKPFVFKQFSVNQEQCAMKIGTDSVLLGAWTSIKDNPFSILDIGAGTGILSLMLAQRSHAEVIDAIEIDDRAYEQCVDNFEQSSWGDRLFCYHATLEEFVDEIEDTYDLIISNPPFYSEDYKTDDEKRDIARFQDAMPFDHLVESVSKLLSKDGIFSIIIPFKEEEKLIDLAANFKLFPNRILHIKGTPTSEIKRSLIEFAFWKIATEQLVLSGTEVSQSSNTKIDNLIIEISRHQYTKDYINLTKDFYLKM